MALKTLYNKESFPDWSRHPYFANMAKLNCFSYLNPIPPQAFGAQSFSQLIHAIFHSSLHCPHQKFLIILVISSQRESGILKQLIVYIGIAWATAFIRTSFTALNNRFSFQPTNFLASFVLTSLKVFFLFLPTKDGRPRYFSN